MFNNVTPYHWKKQSFWVNSFIRKLTSSNTTQVSHLCFVPKSAALLTLANCHPNLCHWSKDDLCDGVPAWQTGQVSSYQQVGALSEDGKSHSPPPVTVLSGTHTAPWQEGVAAVNRPCLAFSTTYQGTKEGTLGFRCLSYKTASQETAKTRENTAN